MDKRKSGSAKNGFTYYALILPDCSNIVKQPLLLKVIANCLRIDE
jgi:hypothetical protein